MPKDGERFINLFIRFEYALKTKGFIQANTRNEVSPDWDRFANETLGIDFFEKIKANGLIPTLLEKPPSKQIISDRGFDWQSGNLPKDIQSLAQHEQTKACKAWSGQLPRMLPLMKAALLI